MPMELKSRGGKAMQLKTTLRSLVEQGLLTFGYPTNMLGRADTTVVLFYHVIGDDGISEHDFERQLDYLAKNFELIFASELATPSSSSKLRVAITFDDGLKNTKEVALPLLRKYEAKATLFVLPCEISWLWTAELRERLALALENGVELDGLPLTNDADIDPLVEACKAMGQDALNDVLDRIRAKTSFEPSDAWLAEHELMTADELRALPEDIIELGAHTIHHPILPSLDDKTLAMEIVESKTRLEALIGRPFKTFSYPNGDFDERCLRLAEQHYDLAFTTESAMEKHPDYETIRNHPHAINRLHGLECHADLPIKMHKFLRQGFGFTIIDEPGFCEHHAMVVPTSTNS